MMVSTSVASITVLVVVPPVAIALLIVFIEAIVARVLLVVIVRLLVAALEANFALVVIRVPVVATTFVEATLVSVMAA